jgi:hypothetical protein
LPDLKRVRRTGGEARRRAQRQRLRRRCAHRLERPVRRRQRRRPRLLEGGGASISRARRSALAAAGLTVLVAAGCGGGRLSHGSFVERADAVCSAYRARTTPVATPRSYDAIVRWGRRTLPLYVAALRKLEALRPPKDDEAAVGSWLAADRRVERAVRDLVAAAQKRDFPSVTEAASRAQLAGSESRSRATSLGLRVCGTLDVSGR